MSMSQKVDSSIHASVDDFIALTRRSSPDEPHIVAALITDKKAEHILAVLPKAVAADNGSARVPPHAELTSRGRVLDTAQALVQNVLYSLPTGLQGPTYLYSTRVSPDKPITFPTGDQYVHWVAYTVSGRSFNAVNKNTPNFPVTEWIRVRDFFCMAHGSIISPTEVHMLLQAFVLYAKSRTNRPRYLKQAEQYLEEFGSLPTVR